MNRLKISVLLLIILGFSIYSNSLKGSFVWDDDFLVKDNVIIKNWFYLPKIFNENIGAGVGKICNFYRPLQIFTYMIDYSLWGLNAAGYHLTNILLHILAVLGLYWFICLLYEDKLLGLFTSILFLVHPVHTEAVTYISGRADSLSLIFLLLCFIFYIKQSSSSDIRIYAAMLVSYIAALLSKENSLILPVLLLLYHYSFRKKIKAREFLTILGITFGYVFLRITVLSSLLPSLSFSEGFFQRIPGFFAAITNYIRLLLLPSNLHMEYGNRGFEFSHPGAILGMAILGALLLCALVKRNNKIVFFAIFWFIITLLPVSNIFPINAYMAEHWLYLPSIGFFLVLAKGLTFFYDIGKYKIFYLNLRLTPPFCFVKRRGQNGWDCENRLKSARESYRRRRFSCRQEKFRGNFLFILGSLFIIGLLTSYSYLTFKQNNYWKEPITFYERNLKYSPRSPRLLVNLGLAYNNTGKKEQAIRLYKQVIRLHPGHPYTAYAYNNLGEIYSNAGEREEAIVLYKKAVEINPKFAGAYYNLGNAYKIADLNEKAVEMFKMAIEINPYFTGAYNNLGVTYAAMGKTGEARALFKKAIGVNPKSALTYKNLSVICYSEKQFDSALHYYNQAVKLGYEVDNDFLKSLESLQKEKLR